MRVWAAALLGVSAMLPFEGLAQELVQEIPLKGNVNNVPAGQLTFSFVPRVPGPSWEITLNPDRSGTYRELTEGVANQPLHVSAAVWERLQAGTGAVRKGHCETKDKGIAQTGSKTFSLGDGQALTSCTFNYSDNDTLNDAASEFLALAEMVQEGAKLQRDRRFDRLALDADMDALLKEIEGGRAAEPGNIAPVLQAIVDDDRVIERVRRKAARLLQLAGPVAPATSASPAALTQPEAAVDFLL